MRAVGEGHISSIAFREGIAGPDGDFSLWPQSGPAMAAVADDRHHLEPAEAVTVHRQPDRSEEHTYELQSLMRISSAVFCLKKKKHIHTPCPCVNTCCVLKHK